MLQEVIVVEESSLEVIEPQFCIGFSVNIGKK